VNNGSSFVVSKTLSKLTKKLNDPRFLRVSRSFLVNFSYIDHFDKLEKVVKLKNGEKIPFTLRIKDLIELVDTIGRKNDV
jgi:DNA-binding LytR/AlgR family response regulator